MLDLWKYMAMQIFFSKIAQKIELEQESKYQTKSLEILY